MNHTDLFFPLIVSWYFLAFPTYLLCWVSLRSFQLILHKCKRQTDIDYESSKRFHDARCPDPFKCQCQINIIQLAIVCMWLFLFVLINMPNWPSQQIPLSIFFCAMLCVVKPFFFINSSMSYLYFLEYKFIPQPKNLKSLSYT